MYFLLIAVSSILIILNVIMLLKYEDKKEAPVKESIESV
jgi:hypothetical protein